MLNAPCRYRIVSEILASYDCDKYTTYGIQAVFECDERLIVYSTVSDISTDRIQVAEMVEIFNEYELSPLHLMDVIEDMLP
jgi:hypothetical protein